MNAHSTATRPAGTRTASGSPAASTARATSDGYGGRPRPRATPRARPPVTPRATRDGLLRRRGQLRGRVSGRERPPGPGRHRRPRRVGGVAVPGARSAPAPSARAPATSSAGRGAARSAPGARDAAASSAPAPAPSTGSPARSATGGRPPPGTSRRTVMGHPDGAHTHGSGGSGLGTAVLVVIGAALAVKLAGPVLDAAAELLHVLLIAAGVIVGVGAASLVGLLAWRWRRGNDAARAMPPRRRWRGPPRRPQGGGAPSYPLTTRTTRRPSSSLPWRLRRRRRWRGQLAAVGGG